jgi:hypothetical protein
MDRWSQRLASLGCGVRNNLTKSATILRRETEFADPMKYRNTKPLNQLTGQRGSVSASIQTYQLIGFNRSLQCCGFVIPGEKFWMFSAGKGPKLCKL